MQKDVSCVVVIVWVRGNEAAWSPVQSDTRVHSAHDEIVDEGCVVDFFICKNCFDYFVMWLSETVGTDEFLHEERFGSESTGENHFVALLVADELVTARLVVDKFLGFELRDFTLPSDRDDATPWIKKQDFWAFGPDDTSDMNSVDIKELSFVLNLASQLISSSNFINNDSISRHQKQVSDGIDGVNLSIEKVIDFVKGFEEDTVFLVASAQRGTVWCDD